jgi:uncharacterized protein YutE (UPF0331/DUF86 family)
VDKEVVLPRLRKLEETINSLRYANKLTLKGYQKDKVIQGYVERNLEIAAETVIDIGNHFIAFYGWKSPDSYKEIFGILAQEKVITPKLAAQLADIASFRNVLVHFYLKLDSSKIYDHLKNDPSVYKAFSRAVYKFLKEMNII